MAGKGNSTGSFEARKAADRRGRASELAAAAMLVARGHIILARRFQTHVGEIDLVARRGKRLAFIEVKHRPSRALCEDAISSETRRRVRRAADLWLARHARYREFDIGFDAVFVVPWRLPVLVRDVL